jgi:D-lactate dehydrogenase (cytochrome)
MPPDAVAFARSTEELSRIVAICARHRTPVIAFGAGTSLEGHVAAPFGGVCVDLSQMNEVLAVRVEDLDCTVQAGVTREQLNAHLRDSGLFFPIDPGANATLGGMVATRASGTNAVRYGTMMQNVLGLTIVLADGSVIRTGGRARKSSAGYDLTRLFTGSEGTLGIIAEITLRLYGRPEKVAAAVCGFPEIGSAVATVTQLIQLGIPVARVELLDEVQVRASNRYSQLQLAERPTLFLEFHGTEAAVAEQAAQAREIADANGGSDFDWAVDEAAGARLWKARHEAYFAALGLRPGCECLVADVCVPVSALAHAVQAARADIDVAGLIAPIVGHVGDGNFHVLFLLDPAAHEEHACAQRVYDRMIERALAAGGTCTGEHGIGFGKRASLVREHGEAAVAVMRRLKDALDPLGILNPGKIFLS